MTDGTTICLDAGQTGIKAEVRRGGVVERRESLPGIVNDGTAVAQLAAAARALVPAQVDGPLRLAAGASGLKDDDSADALLDLVGDVGVTSVHLAHDSTTSYLGALGDEPGAVVAAGTGVVTLGVGRQGVARVDGWGYLLGNAGGGGWIGRRAMEAVMRAHDGRGPATALEAPMRELYPDLETAYLQLAADPERVPRMAAFGVHVAALADTDEVAAEISRAAARELAWSAATALRRVGELGAGRPVVGVGSVFLSAAVARAFSASLAEVAPAAWVAEPRGRGIDGAAALPVVPATSPLYPRVMHAHR